MLISPAPVRGTEKVLVNFHNAVENEDNEEQEIKVSSGIESIKDMFFLYNSIHHL